MARAPARPSRKAERQRHIIAAITANSALGVSELAAELGVSKQTIRRDLDELSHSGVISRTYGGAAALPMGLEPSLLERRSMHQAERDRIANAAAELFHDGDVLMIGPGVTTHHFARRLATRYDRLQVFTNSLSVGTILSSNPGIRVVFLPGDYNPTEGCMTGAESVAFLEKFRADAAVFGASGLTVEGACEVNSGVAWVDRMMLRRSQRHVLLIDGTKFDQPHLELICPVAALDVLVVDRPPTGPLAEALRAAGARVLLTE